MQELLTSIDTENIPPVLFALSYIFMLLLVAGICLNAVFLARIRNLPPDSPELSGRMRAMPWEWQSALALLCVLLLSIASGVIELQIVGLVLAEIYIQQRGLRADVAFGMADPAIGTALPKAFIYMLITLPVFIFYSIAYRALLLYLQVDTGYQDSIEAIVDPSTSNSVRIYIIAMAIVVAPVVEELFFRGILLPAMIKLMPPTRALIMVSMLFALLHFNIASIVPLFILSASFCLAYIYSGNIMVPVFMHAMFNMINIGVLLLLKNILNLVE